MKTKDELIEIAKGINDNTIFCDLNIPTENYKANLAMIFLPIMFGAKVDFEVGLAYAYMHEALPRGANGFPCFARVYFLTIDEAQIVREKLIEIKEVLKQIN